MEENPAVGALQHNLKDRWEQVHTISRAALIKDKIARQRERRTQLLALIDRLKPEDVFAKAEETSTGLPRFCLRRSACSIRRRTGGRSSRPWQANATACGSTHRSREEELARILRTYDKEFPDAIPNGSDDLDERINYDDHGVLGVAAVCRCWRSKSWKS